MRAGSILAGLASALLLAASVSAQLLDDSIDVWYGRHETRLDGDRMHLVIQGAFRLRYGDTVLSAGSGVLSFDRDAFYGWLQGRDRDASSLPHRAARGPKLAAPPRTAQRGESAVLDPLELPEIAVGRTQRLADLIQQVHLQGDVIIERDGFRYLRCEELFLSVPSRRLDARQAELRLPAQFEGTGVRSPIYVRAPRIVQQGARLTARDAVFAPSDQGRPTTRIRTQKLTLTRLQDVFLIQGLGNELLVASLPAVSLPNFERYSDDDRTLPIKGIRVGSSDSRGPFALIEFGGRFHEIGQALLDWAAEGAPRFRGTWRLRTGWMQKRGVPFEPSLRYESEGLFRGELEAYYLEDSGKDVRSPQAWLDGTPIDEDTRTYLRTRNRVELSESTDLDIELFDASDPASYPEFREGELFREEAPETRLYLRWAEQNLRASLSGRWNGPDFAYGDDAALTGRFREEEPEARFDVSSAPLFEIADGVPLVSSLSLRAGRLRNLDTSRAPGLEEQESTRLDALVELSAPLRLGDYGLRFYANARETWYSELVDRDAGGREAFEVGAVASSRWARDFSFGDTLLGYSGLRHELLPQVRVLSRFEVSREASEIYDFDAIDTLREMTAVDFVLLQRLHGTGGEDEDAAGSELVWLDLEQRLYPDADRDNDGDVLGLFKWELLLRPSPRWAFLFEGEHDWDLDEQKTRNLQILTRPLDWLHAGAAWRAGADGDGTGSVNAGVDFWRRWYVDSSFIYNFEEGRSEFWTVGLSRVDYDWMWRIEMTNDILTGDKSFQIRFTPLLDQRFRGPRSGLDDPFFGAASRSSY